MGRRRTTFGRIIRTGFVYFIRNAWLAVAAMATMIITLTIILFSLIVNATFSNQVEQYNEQNRYIGVLEGRRYIGAGKVFRCGHRKASE